MAKLIFRWGATREHWWHVDRPFDDPGGNVLVCDYCGLRTTLACPPSTPCPRREGKQGDRWLLADGSITAEVPNTRARF